MVAQFEIWDNANIVYAYDTQDDALTDVRAMIEANGPLQWRRGYCSSMIMLLLPEISLPGRSLSRSLLPRHPRVALRIEQSHEARQ